MNRAFLIFAFTFGLFIAAASAPSPLYGVFQAQWHFSDLMLTVIFTAYALSLLLALLILGRVSDYIGRRPVLIGTLAVEAVSMAVFAGSRSVVWLIDARLLQGIATGVATATVSAALIDTRPPTKPELAPLVSTIVPVASLGVGAILSSLLVTYGPWPTHLTFWVLCVLCIFMSGGILWISETTNPKAGWRKSLRPSIALPAVARKPFIVASPSLIACWALVGLYLSLGPAVAAGLLRSYLAGGLAILVFTAAGASAMLALKHRPNRQLIVAGSSVAIIGLCMTAWGSVASLVLLFFAGTALAGFGFGPAFMGSFRNSISYAPSDQRAGLAAVIYILSYLALGLPVIVAGYAATRVKLYVVVLVYCAVAILLYTLTLILLMSSSDSTLTSDTS